MFKLRNNINPNLVKVIVLVFLFIAGLFYWLQVRPSFIRSFCADFAFSLGLKHPSLGLQDISSYYVGCIDDRGVDTVKYMVHDNLDKVIEERISKERKLCPECFE